MHLDLHIFFTFFFSQLGKVYFDLQPSWFDTPSSNGRCFKVENFPVTAKDFEAMKYVKSNSKAFTEQAKGNGNLLISIPVRSTSVRKQCSSYESQNRWMHLPCIGFDFLIIFSLGKDYFDFQPSWFDTLSKHAGCLQVENVPANAKDLTYIHTYIHTLY